MLPRREPDFDQLTTVLAKGRPSRPVQFEFLVDPSHLRPFAGDAWSSGTSLDDLAHNWIVGFAAAGYDFAVIPIWETRMLEFPHKNRDHLQSVGMAHGGVIHDRETLEAYPWPNLNDFDYSVLDAFARSLAPKQKIVIHGPGGVLENATELAGYEDLCFLIEDDPDTARELFDRVGSRLLGHYERVVRHPAVGAAIVNDDWGFKTQPFLSPAQMRRFVFPWQRRFVELIHAAGKPAILHSCGNLSTLWDDIVDDLGFDGKHSYEDEIMPVEQVYELMVGRVAVLGGLDLDFLCRSTPAAVADRARSMLDRTRARGGYCLGSGNSIPAYIPHENYEAMLSVGLAS